MIGSEQKEYIESCRWKHGFTIAQTHHTHSLEWCQPLGVAWVLFSWYCCGSNVLSADDFEFISVVDCNLLVSCNIWSYFKSWVFSFQISVSRFVTLRKLWAQKSHGSCPVSCAVWSTLVVNSQFGFYVVLSPAISQCQRQLSEKKICSSFWLRYRFNQIPTIQIYKHALMKRQNNAEANFWQT